MGTKYASVSVSGYNSSPPDDDGTVSEANKVKWSTIKTKLPDPLKTAIESINSSLVTHFDIGPTALTSNTTLGASHYGKIIQASGSGVTLTLTDAATLGAGWYADLYSTDSSNTIALARATAADTIDSTSNDISLLPLESLRIFVNAAANGFRTSQNRVSNTYGVGPEYTQNLSLASSVSANALTVAIKGKNGNDPSFGNPVEIAFRSTTLTSGAYNVRRITAAHSVVAPAGATLGFNASQTAKIHIFEADDGSSRELGVCGRFWLFDETKRYSTTAIGTGSDSAATLYTTNALTDAAIRYLGYITIQTGATPGNWGNSATEIAAQPVPQTAPNQGSVWVQFDTKKTASASTYFTFTDLSSAFDVYEIELVDVKTTTDAVVLKLQASTDNGSSFDTGSNYNDCGGDFAASAIAAFGTTRTYVSLTGEVGVGNAATEYINGRIWLWSPTSSLNPKCFGYELYFRDSAGSLRTTRGQGEYASASAVNAVRLFFGTAGTNTIASGSAYIRAKRYVA